MERMQRYVLFLSLMILALAIVMSNYLYIWYIKDSNEIKLDYDKPMNLNDVPMFDGNGKCINYLRLKDPIIYNGQQVCLLYDPWRLNFVYGISKEEGWHNICGHRGKDNAMCFHLARGGIYEPDNKYYCGLHNPNFAFTVVVIEDLKNTETPTYIVQNDLNHEEEAYGDPDNFLDDIKSSISYKKYIEERGGEGQVNWVISKSYSYIGPDKKNNTIRQTSLLLLRLVLRNLGNSTGPIRLITGDPIETMPGSPVTFDYDLRPEFVLMALEADKTHVEFYSDSLSPPGNPADDFNLYHYIPISPRLCIYVYVGKYKVDKNFKPPGTILSNITNITLDNLKSIRVFESDDTTFCSNILFILTSTQPEKVNLNIVTRMGDSLNILSPSIEFVEIDKLTTEIKVSQLLLIQKFKVEINGDIDWTFNPFEGGETIHLEPQPDHLKIKSHGKVRNMTLNEMRKFLSGIKNITRSGKTLNMS